MHNTKHKEVINIDNINDINRYLKNIFENYETFKKIMLH